MARLQKKKLATDKGKTKLQEDPVMEQGGGNKGAEHRVKPIPQVLKPKTASLVSPAAGKENFYHKTVQFFREVRVELKKVTWPNQKQTAGSTVVVIILVFILAAFLGLVDFGLSKLVQVVLA